MEEETTCHHGNCLWHWIQEVMMCEQHQLDGQVQLPVTFWMECEQHSCVTPLPGGMWTHNSHSSCGNTCWSNALSCHFYNLFWDPQTWGLFQATAGGRKQNCWINYGTLKGRAQELSCFQSQWAAKRQSPYVHTVAAILHVLTKMVKLNILRIKQYKSLLHLSHSDTFTRTICISL